jgi:hypothetical protein
MKDNQELQIVPQQEAAVLEAQERAAIDVQIATARKYPRKAMSVIKQNMMSFATLDEETAASCFYKIPRAGGMIEGASVRLAEITAACYGNLRVATRVTETVTDGPTPHVVVQSAVHDLENNLAVQIEKRRRITHKRNATKPDQDDINLATNACASIAFRDAVFRIVPNVLITPVLEAAKKVAVGNATSLAERRTKVMQRLAQMGASQDRVLQSIGLKKVEDIGLEQLEKLIGLGTALKDGGTVEEVFKIEASATTPQPAPQNAPPSQPAAPEGAGTGTPQGDLAQLVLSSGYTFNQFQKWGDESGNVPDASSLASFTDVSTATAKRLLRAKTGLIEGLKRIAGK